VPITDTTANRGYAKPNIANALSDDVTRLRTGLDSIDTDVATLLPRLLNTANGAASSPPGLFSGTWFSGGTATTTKPQLLIEPSGTTSTGWSTSGTGVGVNAPSGFTGRLLDLQLAGSSKVVVEAGGNVGIGIPNPSANLHTYAASGTVINRVQSGSGFGEIAHNGSDFYVSTSTGSIQFYGSGSERCRIDSSGRLLVGTSAARTNFFNGSLGARLQVEGNGPDSWAAFIADDNSTSPAILIIGKQRSGSVGGNTVVQANDETGRLSFQGSDGTEFIESATIASFVDGTPGSNDMPGRLVFSTTADGASSPTERLRISSDGAVKVAGDNFQIATSKTPASASATGTTGQIAWDSSYLYVAVGTDTWKRVAIATW
jgi:hypothetical protein